MTPDVERDEDLMWQVAQGCSERLGPLLRRHATPLLSFIHRMVGDRHRSEELFQEVFLAVWLKRGQYQFPRPFKPWLYAVALNRCREALRSRRPGVVQLPDEGERTPCANGPGPPDHIMAAETAEVVAAAVLALPPQQRAVVLLRIWDGLSYADIAPVVGCSLDTVRSHMHHALKALRQALTPRLGALRLPEGVRGG
jgi:RNA polymerase sigma-70 factor (ECF subfamily)